MIPKLHKKGTSFRGAAAYVLHDKGRATSSDRVAWTETQNLATTNPQAAWRVMAATAMSQARLKGAAGIKTTGRKSNEHVLHFTLSWHQDEAATLTPAEMMRAARGAITALGADDRQALIVAHRDEPQPHLHVVLNRVSPEDGRLLSSSKEKLALSRWAEQYEKDRGRVLCHERVVNNAARKRGQYVRGKPNRPRHVVEREAVNDNTPQAAHVRAEQRKKDHAISQKRRQDIARHRLEREQLTADHRQRVANIRLDTRRTIGQACRRIQEQFKPAFVASQKRQAAELQQFAERERTFLGRLSNRVSAVDIKGLVTGEKSGQQVLTDGFRALASAGSRLEQLKRRHFVEQKKIVTQQRAAEAMQVRKLRLNEKEKRSDNNHLFTVTRAELRLRESMDTAAVRAAWKHRRADRVQTWDTFERERPATTPVPINLSEEMRKVSDLRELAKEINARRRAEERKQEKNRERD